jgi:hypothetical protein
MNQCITDYYATGKISIADGLKYLGPAYTKLFYEGCRKESFSLHITRYFYRTEEEQEQRIHADEISSAVSMRLAEIRADRKYLKAAPADSMNPQWARHVRYLERKYRRKLWSEPMWDQAWKMRVHRIYMIHKPINYPSMDVVRLVGNSSKGLRAYAYALQEGGHLRLFELVLELRAAGYFAVRVSNSIEFQANGEVHNFLHS